MNQILWQERYTYDRNGNRASKITPWGTIAYTYDRENRMITKGDIRLSYDKDGNLLSERGTRRTATYQYNGQNRMVSSEVTEVGQRNRTTAQYWYDAYGRRTITQEAGGDAMRTVYDGFSFDVIREGVTFVDGSLTTRYATGAITAPQTQTQGLRYRYLGDDTTGGDRTRTISGEVTSESRYTGIAVTLYGRRGEAVAVSRIASTGSRGGTAYLGKDLMGSVRSTTGDQGTLEARYEYDAFGKPYKGDFNTGMSLGYTGKPYDTATGMYNYGYRDYKPEAARFTTVDPIRDGSNWFAYVNNDPVNWIDVEGLYAKVTVDLTNKTITIQIPIVFTNDKTGKDKVPDADYENAKTKYKAEIAAAWSHVPDEENLSSDPFGGFAITTEVVEAGIKGVAGINCVVLQQGVGGLGAVGTPVEGKPSHVIDNRFGVWFTSDGSSGLGAHEAGHLLGLPDRYIESTRNGQRYTPPKPGFETNLMATTNGSISALDIVNILRIGLGLEPTRHPKIIHLVVVKGK